MILSRHMAAAFRPIVDLVYPPRCPLCGEGLASQTGLCADCWAQLAIPSAVCCTLCQRPFSSDFVAQDTVCAPCLAQEPTHDGIAAATLYNDASRRLVLAFKHGRRIALAPMLARLMAARLPPLDGEWLIVPVPLHPVRLWQRGFNQAAILARELAGQTGERLCVDALARRKHTPSLGKLSRKARARAISGAIAATPARASQIDGAQILLVDDVLTSGATTNACVGALRRAGAARVKIACFARVVDEMAEGSG